MMCYSTELPELDLTYAYSTHKKRYLYFWKQKLCLKDELKEKIINNIYLLPPWLLGGYLFGRGGVVDYHLMPIQESWMMGLHNDCYMGGKYNFDVNSVQMLKGSYVYLGFINNHWGHFLRDFTTRLYIAIKYPDAKYIFLIQHNKNNFELYPSIRRFFMLLGINEKNILFINKPTFVEELIIPEQSYHMGEYVSSQYYDIFSRVIKNINPVNNDISDKIFFSRAKWNRGCNKELGLQLIDELFLKNNFKIIYPEEESLDDQIKYIINAKEIGAVSGSLIHNFIFAFRNKPHVYLVNKTYLIASSMYETCKLAGCSTSLLDFFAVKFPTSYGYGPFALVRNDNMKRYEVDNHIELDNINYWENDYIKYMVLKYNRLFYNLEKYCYKFICYSSDYYSIHYYDIRFLLDWIINYGKYENDAITYPNQYDNYQILINKLLNCHIDVPLVIYNVCLSTLGWGLDVVEGMVAGVFDISYSIEAIKILINNQDNIYYRVFHFDTGWSNVSANGALCGITGKGVFINGFKVWLGNLSANYNILYRAYSGKWSAWKKNGQELIVNENISGIEVKLELISAKKIKYMPEVNNRRNPIVKD